MGLILNESQDFQYVDNTESVVYYRRLTNTTFDNGTIVPHALRRLATKQELTAGGASLAMQGLVWNIWTAEVGGSATTVFSDPSANWDGSATITTTKPTTYVKNGQLIAIGLSYVVRIVSVVGNTIIVSTTPLTGTPPAAGTLSVVIVASNPQVNDKIGSGPFELFDLSMIVNGGTGYLVSDILTLPGTFSIQATLQVSSISAGGVITGANVLAEGNYTTLPSNPVQVAGGSGMDAALNFDWMPIDPGNYWSCLRVEWATWRTRWRITTVQELS